MVLAFMGAMLSLFSGQPGKAAWFAMAGLIAAIIGRPR
jgi:hypothetical protein